MNASVEVAAELEEMFDRPLTSPVGVLDGAEEVREGDPTPDDPAADPDDEPVIAVLTRVGYEVHPTDRAPFKAVGEAEHPSIASMLTGHSDFDRTAEKRARIMSSVGRVTRTRSVYVVDRATRDAVEGTALVEREEMERVEDADDLRDLIQDRVDIDVEEPA